MKKHHVIGRTFIFAGLTLAVLLAAAGMRSSRTTIKLAGKATSLTELDQLRILHGDHCESQMV